MRGNIFDPLGIFEGVERDLDRISDLVTSPSNNPCGCNPGNPSRPYTRGEVYGFRSIRSAVMDRTWDRVEEVEGAGQVVTSQMFGNILQDEWDRARQAAQGYGL